jgi:hypothetical protein
MTETPEFLPKTAFSVEIKFLSKMEEGENFERESGFLKILFLFGHHKEDLAGGWRRLHNEELH